VQDAGRAVPQSVAVIGVDNSPYAYVTTPRLTSLDTKLGELSLGCARALVDAVEGKPGKKKQVIVSSIVLRETT
jgi:DNA-binding LacI/PurR family transcriptional regulator